jgi:hypothetical protein
MVERASPIAGIGIRRNDTLNRLGPQPGPRCCLDELVARSEACSFTSPGAHRLPAPDAGARRDVDRACRFGRGRDPGREPAGISGELDLAVHDRRRELEFDGLIRRVHTLHAVSTLSRTVNSRRVSLPSTVTPDQAPPRSIKERFFRPEGCKPRKALCFRWLTFRRGDGREGQGPIYTILLRSTLTLIGPQRADDVDPRGAGRRGQ